MAANNHPIRIGSVSFTAHGLKEFFYPPRMKPNDYLGYYAARFNTVEIDNTFYRVPKRDVVLRWNDSVPSDFRFTVKFPQKITHLKRLQNVESEVNYFYSVLEPLFSKTTALLVQMPKYSAQKFDELAYLQRLRDFFDLLPASSPPIAIEIRDPARLTSNLVEFLREHHVGLVWVDIPEMPKPQQYLSHPADLLPTEWSYIRLMGDRDVVNERTSTFEKGVVNRLKGLQQWIDVFEDLRARGQQLNVFVSAYYEGNAAWTIDRLKREWAKRLPKDESQSLLHVAA